MIHYVNEGFIGLEDFQVLCSRRVRVVDGKYVTDEVDCPECVRRHDEMRKGVEGECPHEPTRCAHYSLYKFQTEAAPEGTSCPVGERGEEGPPGVNA